MSIFLHFFVRVALSIPIAEAKASSLTHRGITVEIIAANLNGKSANPFPKYPTNASLVPHDNYG